MGPSKSAPELRMDSVVAGYYSSDPVLNRVSLAAVAHRVTVILGPNGSGKSTALRVIYGILCPRHGEIKLGDRNISAVPSWHRLDLGMAYLPQGRSVFGDLTVQENLELGGWKLRNDRMRHQAAVESMYDRYPILKEWRRKPARALSGGQQRLLEIARMMVADPQLILLDEPSAGLAPILVDQVYTEIGRMREEKRTILLVDQNVQAAVAVADYIYVLEQGRNYMQGERADFEGKLAPLIKGWLKF